MTSQSPIQKSLVEQILDDMFAGIEARKEFDKDTVDQLKHLASTGNLQKAAQVVKAIKSPPGVEP